MWASGRVGEWTRGRVGEWVSECANVSVRVSVRV